LSQSLVGSRYEMHVAKEGVAEGKQDKDYFAIYATDVEESAKAGDDVTGYVHSYEVGSTVDGPGLRFVAFLTGCLLRCQYCHNPDTWHKRNGKPVTVRARDAGNRQVRARVEDQQRRHHAFGRRAAASARFRYRGLSPLQAARSSHLSRHIRTAR
jgi:hypothetical protein